MKGKSLKVFSQIIPLEESDPKDWSEGGLGRTSIARGITINKGLPDEAKRHIVLHEFVHFVSMLMDLEIGEKENEVSTVAGAILSLVRENPEFIKWLQETEE